MVERLDDESEELALGFGILARLVPVFAIGLYSPAEVLLKADYAALRSVPGARQEAVEVLRATSQGSYVVCSVYCRSGANLHCLSSCCDPMGKASWFLVTSPFWCQPVFPLCVTSYEGREVSRGLGFQVLPLRWNLFLGFLEEALDSP